MLGIYQTSRVLWVVKSSVSSIELEKSHTRRLRVGVVYMMTHFLSSPSRPRILCAPRVVSRLSLSFLEALRPSVPCTRSWRTMDSNTWMMLMFSRWGC